jgi:dolichol-phosphate mannosyltransferase
MSHPPAQRPRLFVLLPVYNEAAGIEAVLSKLDSFARREALDYRVVVVDDGSTDGTAEILETLARSLPLEILTHKHNRGLGETVRDLFERSAELAGNDDVIVRLDADDTHDPRTIGSMLAAIDAGCDVVIASRFARGGGQFGLSRWRRFLSAWANRFMKIVFPIPGVREYTCGFRAYRGRVIHQAIEEFGNDFIQLKGLGFTSTLEKLVKLRLVGAQFCEVPFVLRYDQKESASKMVTNITTLGYFVMAVMYYWPRGGWRDAHRKERRAEKRSASRLGRP